MSLEVFNLCKCYIALVTFENTSLVQHWCKCDCKWISFILSQAGALCGELRVMEAYIVNQQLTTSLSSDDGNSFDGV